MANDLLQFPANNWRRRWASAMVMLGVIITFFRMAVLSYGVIGLIFWAI